MKSLFLIFSISLLIASCGKDGPSIHNLGNEFSLQELTEKSKINCKIDEGCPTSSVKLLMQIKADKNSSLGSCSGFFVAKDIIATNGHCIPDDLQKVGANCSGRINVLYLENGHTKYEGCQEVLKISFDDGQVSLQDYAFIKLKNLVSSARPYETSPIGVHDNKKLIAIVNSPIHGKPEESDFKKVNCKSSQHTEEIGSYNHDHAPVALLTNCNAIKGNSGSAVVDSNYKVNGILSHAGYLYNDYVSYPFAMMSNFACIQDPVQNPSAFDSHCNQLDTKHDYRTYNDGNYYKDLAQEVISHYNDLFYSATGHKYSTKDISSNKNSIHLRTFASSISCIDRESLKGLKDSSHKYEELELLDYIISHKATKDYYGKVISFMKNSVEMMNYKRTITFNTKQLKKIATLEVLKLKSNIVHKVRINSFYVDTDMYELDENIDPKLSLKICED